MSLLDNLLNPEKDSYMVVYNPQSKSLENKFKIEPAFQDYMKQKGFTHSMYLEKDNVLYIIFGKKDSARGMTPSSMSHLKLDGHANLIRQFELFGNKIPFKVDENTDSHLILSRPVYTKKPEPIQTRIRDGQKGPKQKMTETEIVAMLRRYHVERVSAHTLAKENGICYATFLNYDKKYGNKITMNNTQH